LAEIDGFVSRDIAASDADNHQRVDQYNT
jgi:hypothetical protein